MDKVQQSLLLTVEDYEKADTSVWWDTGSCGIPRDCNLYGIVDNIKLSLRRLNYQGKISIYVHGLEETFEGLDHLTLIEKDIRCFTIGGKATINKNVINDMLIWVMQNNKPANILLISEDPEFSDVLNHLRQRKYNILLALLDICNPPSLVLTASTIWLWSKLSKGKAPDVVKPITCLPGFENTQPPSEGQKIWKKKEKGEVSGFKNALPQKIWKKKEKE